ETEAVSHIREGQPVADEGVGQGVDLCHSPNVPHRVLSQTRRPLFTSRSPAPSSPVRGTRGWSRRPRRPGLPPPGGPRIAAGAGGGAWDRPAPYESLGGLLVILY